MKFFPAPTIFRGENFENFENFSKSEKIFINFQNQKNDKIFEIFENFDFFRFSDFFSDFRFFLKFCLHIHRHYKLFLVQGEKSHRLDVSIILAFIQVQFSESDGYCKITTKRRAHFCKRSPVPQYYVAGAK